MTGLRPFAGFAFGMKPISAPPSRRAATGSSEAACGNAQYTQEAPRLMPPPPVSCLDLGNCGATAGLPPQAFPLTHLPHHARGMEPISLATFAGLLSNCNELACHGLGRRRRASTNLAQVIALGLGDRPITAHRPRCRKCGSTGEWQVRPPIPKFDGYRKRGPAAGQAFIDSN